MTDTAGTFRNEKDRQKDRRQRKIAEVKRNIWRFSRGVFWRVMWAIRLAKPYSRLMCRLNLYPKFSDGRCQWCGD